MSDQTEIVIASGARTPIGAFNGSFSAIPAHTLGAAAITAALSRAVVHAGDVSEVMLGQVLTAGAGMNPARQAAMAAGVPKERTALGINQVCGSGLRAVALGAQAIRAGDASVIVAGGQESMTQSPHVSHLRAGTKMGNAQLIDSMINDGLWDVFNGYHMGITAENVATQWQISRDQQDAFALQSQERAKAAQKAGIFRDEIVPVTVPNRKGDILIEEDEHPRHDTTIETLKKLRPAFDKEGSVTAGNASGINDGAAAVVLMSAAEATKRGVEPLAKIKSWATEGIDPAIMGAGPIPASKTALEKAGWSSEDVDLIEANEAFAAQACAVAKEMGWDNEKINVNGGAIALGHPIGASGARVLITLLYELKRRGANKGLATLCIGGGMGIAMCVER